MTTPAAGPESRPPVDAERVPLVTSGRSESAPPVDAVRVPPVTSGRNESAPPADPARGTIVDWLLVVWIGLLAACTAVLGLAFLPWYIGPVPMPISALLGVAAMVLAPRTCYGLTGSLLAAALPVAAWFAVSVWLVLSYNRMLPQVPLTVATGQWRVMVLLGLGSLAAAATLGLIWGDRLRARIAAEQSEKSVAIATPGR